MVGLGLLSAADALQRLLDEWDIFLFFLGLSLSSVVADQGGVFRAAAALAVRWAAGSQVRLLVGLFAVGALVTGVLSNDATALLLTPVAFALATRAGVSPRPYAFACALVANAASFLLPVSNPSNLVLLGREPMSLGGFLGRLLFPEVLALLATLAGLLIVFRTDLRERFESPTSTQPPGRRARLDAAGVAALAVGYIVAAALGLPLGVVAVVGGLTLVAIDGAVASTAGEGSAGGWQPRRCWPRCPGVCSRCSPGCCCWSLAPKTSACLPCSRRAFAPRPAWAPLDPQSSCSAWPCLPT